MTTLDHRRSVRHMRPQAKRILISASTRQRAGTAPPRTKPSEKRGRLVAMAIGSVLVVLLCAGCLSTSTVHPEFGLRAKRMTNLVVLPVPATAIQVQVAGAKQIEFPQVQEFCERLRSLIAQQWEQRGFQVTQSRLKVENWGAINNGFEDRDVWMRLQLQRANGCLAPQTRANRLECIRPEAPLLAEYEGADVLVFAGASTVLESPGAKGTRWTYNVLAITVGLTMAVLTGGTQPDLMDSPERNSLEVILVEGRTGEVLWRSWARPKSLKGPKLDAAVKKLFAHYPKE